MDLLRGGGGWGATGEPLGLHVLAAGLRGSMGPSGGGANFSSAMVSAAAAAAAASAAAAAVPYDSGVGGAGGGLGGGAGVVPWSNNDSAAQRSIGEKLMRDPPPPNSREVALLIVVATVGMVGNFGILIVILVLRSLRRASSAFLFHQSALDLLKSAYCLPFAQTMVNEQPPTFCSMMGGSYIVFVTTSAFNLLAMVMNEAYQFADLMMGIKDSRNYCCVIFGIFMIWFTSIIMNLGVAFIPGNPSFDREMGHCIFVYGITRNYVLHMLWIVLITMALVLTSVYLRMLYVDIKRSSYYRMTTLIRATVSIDTNVRTASQRRQSYQREKHQIKRVLRVTRKKLYLLVALTVFFVLFWYPLFMLTAGDPGFNISPDIYKTVTIVAWCNPTVTPIILFFFIKTVCCCRDSDHVMTLLDRGLEEGGSRSADGGGGGGGGGQNGPGGGGGGSAGGGTSAGDRSDSRADDDTRESSGELKTDEELRLHDAEVSVDDDDDEEDDYRQAAVAAAAAAASGGGGGRDETGGCGERRTGRHRGSRPSTGSGGIYNQFYSHDGTVAMSMSSLTSGGGGGGGGTTAGGAGGGAGVAATGDRCPYEDTTVTSAYGYDTPLRPRGAASVSSVCTRDGAISTSTCYTEAPTRTSSVDVPDTPEHRDTPTAPSACPPSCPVAVPQPGGQPSMSGHVTDTPRRRGHLRKDSKSASLWI